MKIWHSFIVKIKHDEITFYKKKKQIILLILLENAQIVDGERSESVPRLEHDNTVSPHHDLTCNNSSVGSRDSITSITQNFIFTNFALCGAVLIEFSGIVQDQVHEGVKATEDTLDLQIKVP